MIDETYMRRCFQLAKLAAGNVAPNPMVGAVLVYNDRIIGEGYHQQYGKAHAEVNCIDSVKEADKQFISVATIYVSLEPCAHYGKTPPCADLIIQSNIPQVVIGCRDSYKEVAGKGIEKLQNAGVSVSTGVLEQEAIELNKQFFTFHEKQRPYIILKWAQTGDGKIGNGDGERLMISNDYTNRLVHKWRSEVASILVGTNTALKDNPALTTRLWKGNNPVRLVIDKLLQLPTTLSILDGTVKTIVFNSIRQVEEGNIQYYKLSNSEDFIPEMMQALFKLNIQTVLVEGGATLLQHFIDSGVWDEARIITNQQLHNISGIAAPKLSGQMKTFSETFFSDTIGYFKKA
ncbi:MAG: bifunctional diaminohydroxyphosphoribosylaminopyrimidine deaminase/5-amino-6-(5-phosphoribosylamino)uracil reductase RibD [Ferruginibacter sp.]